MRNVRSFAAHALFLLVVLFHGVKSFVPQVSKFSNSNNLNSRVHIKNKDKNAVILRSEPDDVMKGVADSVSKTPDPSTKDFIMQQTMIRIKDPKASLDFYTRILGMSLLTAVHFDEWKFSIYFVGYADTKDIPEDKAERAEWCMRQPGTVELTHNWGTESDPEFKGYHNGNDQPQGFGHIGITVPDVYAACQRFEELGVQFRKKPDEGGMKGLAFVLDPDGYSIEVLSAAAFKADFTKYCSNY
mmetsp:Transcript_24717/g.32269  ORF Transcript_24717/g.32269 Transcript_24717/m.32269 type:complete len:243 (-) Transcript_24717:408-1136(-)|eukprot:CAMPEP_0117757018 /NCGR_PEP_ID=MMETSP0947-20121206/14459_1 /TAXON_ID=44440 /ORGANISM="Chattonella subsalsa, Strain CCMP2191" /LENGTH=242 /DNA_ID=CAMNT_0005576787 /DNA_START=42 /DNA_END=770 /DNA_ORIENTATION=-